MFGRVFLGVSILAVIVSALCLLGAVRERSRAEQAEVSAGPADPSATLWLELSSGRFDRGDFVSFREGEVRLREDGRRTVYPSGEVRRFALGEAWPEWYPPMGQLSPARAERFRAVLGMSPEARRRVAAEARAEVESASAPAAILRALYDLSFVVLAEGMPPKGVPEEIVRRLAGGAGGTGGTLDRAKRFLIKPAAEVLLLPAERRRSVAEEALGEIESAEDPAGILRGIYALYFVLLASGTPPGDVPGEIDRRVADVVEGPRERDLIRRTIEILELPAEARRELARTSIETLRGNPALAEVARAFRDFYLARLVEGVPTEQIRQEAGRLGFERLLRELWKRRKTGPGVGPGGRPAGGLDAPGRPGFGKPRLPPKASADSNARPTARPGLPRPPGAIRRRDGGASRPAPSSPAPSGER